MNRIQEILTRARYTLADPKAERWSDAQLLSYLDEAQKDLCRRAKMLRSEVTFNVLEGISEYTMPDDFLLLDLVLFNDRSLSLVGHAEIESRDCSWAEREGQPEAVIYDKQMRGKIRLYPVPQRSGRWLTKTRPTRVEDVSARIKQNFGCVSKVKFPSQIFQDYGVATSIKALWQFQEEADMPSVLEVDYKFKSDFGVVTKANLVLKSEVETPTWGITTSFQGVATDQLFGLVTDIKGADYAAIRFTDSYGVGTSILMTENYGYYTHFQGVGIVTDVCGAKVEDLGIINSISEISGSKVVFTGDFGLNSGLFLSTDTLRVFYLRKPKTLTSLESELEVDTSFDTALKFYVTGSALTSSINTGDRTFGASELQRYGELVAIAEKDDSKDFTRSSKVWYSEYNGGFR